jgi:hypothetical protein
MSSMTSRPLDEYITRTAVEAYLFDLARYAAHESTTAATPTFYAYQRGECTYDHYGNVWRAINAYANSNLLHAEWCEAIQ